MKKLKKILLDLKLIVDESQSTTHYTETKGNSQQPPNIQNFLRKLPHWLQITYKDSDKLKKIIVNDWHHLLAQLSAVDAKLFGLLFDCKFEFYIRLGAGKLKQIQTVEELFKQHLQIELEDKEIILDELTAIGDDPHAYFVYNHKSRSQFINKLALYLEIETNSDDLKEEPIITPVINQLSEKNRFILAGILNDTKLYPRIHYKVPNEICQFTLTFENKFSLALLKGLLECLACEKFGKEGLLSPVICEKATELNIYKTTSVLIDVGYFVNLQKLSIWGHFQDAQLKGIENCLQLEMLSITDINIKLEELRIEKLEKLTYLHQDYNKTFTSMDNIKHFKYLNRLNLYYMTNYLKVLDFSDHPHLKHLDMYHNNYDNWSLVKDSKIPHLETLKIDILKPDEAQFLQPLLQLESLNKIILDRVGVKKDKVVFNVPPKADLLEFTETKEVIISTKDYQPYLKKIKLNGEQIPTVSFALIPNLETVEISDDFSDLKMLDLADLKNCKQLTVSRVKAEINNLEHLDSLTSLSLSNLPNLSKLDLSKLINLEVLILEKCLNLVTLQGLEQCKKLKTIILKELNKLENSTFEISSLSQLTNLELNNIPIANLVGLANAKLLQHLVLHRLNVEMIDISGLDNLFKLSLEANAKLNILKGLGLSSVESVYIHRQSLLKLENADLKDIVLIDIERLPEGIKNSSKPSLAYSEFLHKKEQAFYSQVTKYTQNNGTTQNPSQNSGQSQNSSGFASALQSLAGLFVKSDSNTRTHASNKLEVNEIFSSKMWFLNPDVSEYRKHICDRIRIDENNIVIFEPAELDILPEPIVQQEIKDHRQYYKGTLKLELNKGEIAILDGLSSNDKVNLEFDPNIICYPCRNTQRYIVSLIEDSVVNLPYVGTLKYGIKPDKNYFCKYIKLPLAESILPHELPASLYQVMTEKLFTPLPNQNEKRNRQCSSWWWWLATPEEDFTENLVKLQAIYNEKSFIKKTNLIIKYCRGFQNDDLTATAQSYTHGSIDSFVATILERKGACRHSANAYLALCLYFRIPARMIYNQVHAFSETAIQSGQEVVWVGTQLSGAAVTLDFKQELFKARAIKHAIPKPRESKGSPINDPMMQNSLAVFRNNLMDLELFHKKMMQIIEDEGESKLKSEFKPIANNESKSEFKPIANNESKSIISIDADLKVDKPKIPPENLWLKCFFSSTAMMMKAKNWPEFIDTVIHHFKPVLIKTPRKEDAWRVNTMFVQYLETKNISSCYVDSRRECNFTMPKVQDNQWLDLDSKLKEFIAKGKGVLIINWNGFDDNAKAKFKSVMDTPATLHGLLMQQIKVVGLLSESTQPNDVFLSRCDPVLLPASLMLPAELYPIPDWLKTTKPEAKVDEIDLYKSSEWQKGFTEDITLDEDNFSAVKGALLLAMDAGKPLIAYDVPFEEETFKRSWYQLTLTNEIIFNGDIPIKPKKGFSLILLDRNAELKIPSCVKIYNAIQDENSICYGINREYFNQLFEIQFVTQKQQIKKAEGILTSYRSGEYIVIQDKLNNNQWRRLFDVLDIISRQSSLIYQLVCKFELLPESIRNQIESKVELKCKDNSKLINEVKLEVKSEMTFPLDGSIKLLPGIIPVSSNDIYFAATHIQQQMRLESNTIFYLHHGNAWSELIETAAMFNANNKIRIHQQERPFLDEVKKDKILFLCGELAERDYFALQTLFLQKPYLFVNGKRIDVKAKIIWIYPTDKKPKEMEIKSYSFQVSSQHYEKKLKDETLHCINEVIPWLNSLWEYIQPVFKNTLTYAKYQAVYDCITTKSDSDSTCKSVLNYHLRKGSEQYAYVNVISKLLFSIVLKGIFVRTKKLSNLLESIQTQDDFNQHIWRIANCFSAKSLKSFLTTKSYVIDKTKLNSNQVPDATAEFISDILSAVCYVIPEFKKHGWVKLDKKTYPEYIDDLVNCAPGQARFAKQQKRLRSALQDPTKPILFLIGEAGTGKTYSVSEVYKELKEGDSGIKLYVGENQIENWFNSKNGWLLLDEANLEPTGKWEFLRGLKTSPRSIYYNNKTYNDDDLKNLKVIATGNPLHYAKRKYHPVFFDHAHLIWFAAFQPCFIENLVQKTLLDSKSVIKQTKTVRDVSKRITFHYEELRKNTDCAGEVTIRDIKNILARFVIFCVKYGEENYQGLLTLALLDEMSGLLANNEARVNWKQMLSRRYGLFQPECKDVLINPNFAVTKEKMPIWNSILDDFLLRKERIKQGHNALGKLGTLLEGSSGEGKSAMFIAICEFLGLTRATEHDVEHAESLQNKYYQATAGSEGLAQKIKKIFHKGGVIIFDELNLGSEIELNLGSEIELLLNWLLTGTDPSLTPAKYAGFQVLASQNPAKFAGCQMQSKALVNRMRKIIIDNFSDSELQTLAKLLKHPDPKGFLTAYQKARLFIPGLNARSFIIAMHQSKKEYLSLDVHYENKSESQEQRFNPLV